MQSFKTKTKTCLKKGVPKKKMKNKNTCALVCKNDLMALVRKCIGKS